MALPPLEDQRTLLVSLNEVTASLCRAIDRQHVGVALLREYRTRLIADVVTGKFDVRAAAARLPDEVEELEPVRLEFPILSLHPGLRQRCVAPDVWPTLSRA